jgi:hypothetical protein
VTSCQSGWRMARRDPSTNCGVLSAMSATPFLGANGARTWEYGVMRQQGSVRCQVTRTGYLADQSQKEQAFQSSVRRYRSEPVGSSSFLRRRSAGAVAFTEVKNPPRERQKRRQRRNPRVALHANSNDWYRLRGARLRGLLLGFRTRGNLHRQRCGENPAAAKRKPADLRARPGCPGCNQRGSRPLVVYHGIRGRHSCSRRDIPGCGDSFAARRRFCRPLVRV